MLKCLATVGEPVDDLHRRPGIYLTRDDPPGLQLLQPGGKDLLRNGFFVQNGGIEYTLVLGVSALSLAFTGPGTLSLDYALGISWSGAPWGVFALALGALGGGFHIFASRRSTPQPARQA